MRKNSKFDDHFILLSREIHLNDKRANIKLEINNHTGSKIKEIKEYINIILFKEGTQSSRTIKA